MDRIEVGRVGVDKEGFLNIPVDRSTVLGNPYPKTRFRTREDSIEAYEEYLLVELTRPTSRVKERIIRLFWYLEKGENLNLQCWCYPESCHAQAIKTVLEFLLEQSRNTL